MTLTEKQTAVLMFIGEYKATKGYAPSAGDIAKHFEFSPQSARFHIMALERAGAIRTTPNVPRSIVLL